jgi:hypothetical protein
MKLDIDISLHIKKTRVLSQLNQYIKIYHIILKELAKVKRTQIEERQKNITSKYIYQNIFEHQIGKILIYSLSDAMTLDLKNKIDIYCKNSSILQLLFLEKLTLPKLISLSDIEEICFLLRIKQLIHNVIKDQKQNLPQSDREIFNILNEHITKKEISFDILHRNITNKLNWYMKIIGLEVIIY